MPSLKPLKSVAHSLAHQFASTLNYWHNDYAINHLANAARSNQAAGVVIDILAQQITPHAVQSSAVAEFLPKLKASLAELLRKEGFSIEILEAATLSYNFSVGRADLLFHQPTYDCVSSLVTRDGRTFRAQLTEKSN